MSCLQFFIYNLDIGLVHHVMCAFTPRLLLVLIHKGMARLSWPGWLFTHLMTMTLLSANRTWHRVT